MEVDVLKWLYGARRFIAVITLFSVISSFMMFASMFEPRRAEAAVIVDDVALAVAVSLLATVGLIQVDWDTAIQGAEDMLEYLPKSVRDQFIDVSLAALAAGAFFLDVSAVDGGSTAIIQQAVNDTRKIMTETGRVLNAYPVNGPTMFPSVDWTQFGQLSISHSAATNGFSDYCARVSVGAWFYDSVNGWTTYVTLWQKSGPWHDLYAYSAYPPMYEAIYYNDMPSIYAEALKFLAQLTGQVAIPDNSISVPMPLNLDYMSDSYYGDVEVGMPVGWATGRVPNVLKEVDSANVPDVISVPQSPVKDTVNRDYTGDSISDLSIPQAPTLVEDPAIVYDPAIGGTIETPWSFVIPNFVEEFWEFNIKWLSRIWQKLSEIWTTIKNIMSFVKDFMNSITYILTQLFVLLARVVSFIVSIMALLSASYLFIIGAIGLVVIDDTLPTGPINFMTMTGDKVTYEYYNAFPMIDKTFKFVVDVIQNQNPAIYSIFIAVLMAIAAFTWIKTGATIMRALNKEDS